MTFKPMVLPEIDRSNVVNALSDDLKAKLGGRKYPMGIIVMYSPVEQDMQVIPLNCSELEAVGMLAVAPSVVMDAYHEDQV